MKSEFLVVVAILAVTLAMPAGFPLRLWTAIAHGSEGPTAEPYRLRDVPSQPVSTIPADTPDLPVAPEDDRGEEAADGSSEEASGESTDGESSEESESSKSDGTGLPGENTDQGGNASTPVSNPFVGPTEPPPQLRPAPRPAGTPPPLPPFLPPPGGIAGTRGNSGLGLLLGAGLGAGIGYAAGENNNRRRVVSPFQPGADTSSSLDVADAPDTLCPDCLGD